MSSLDVIVLGGGVAGLAAAVSLQHQGLSYRVMEARNRWGGRIHTLHPKEVSGPVELGAEFVHGLAPETWRIAKQHALDLPEVPDSHWQKRGDKIVQADFWDQVGPIMESINEWAEANPDRDRSFAEHAHLSAFPDDQRKLALAFVEGFHAADAEKISLHALALLQIASEAQEEERSFHVAAGYDAFVATFLSQIPEANRSLDCTVTEVDWTAEGVIIHTAREKIHARCAIVTLPLGVLKAGTVRFVPELAAKREALAGLEMGSAVRITFQFRSAFWETKLPTDHAIGFFHTGAADFPTWWTCLPLSSTRLTAWMGGTAAKRLAGQPRDQVRRKALETLAGFLSLSLPEVQAEVVGEWMHDWENDPFTRGAYSYAAKNGSEMHARLAEPLGALFFAGEATQSTGDNATVSGAISTGERAAREVARYLRSRQ